MIRTFRSEDSGHASTGTLALVSIMDFDGNNGRITKLIHLLFIEQIFERQRKVRVSIPQRSRDVRRTEEEEVEIVPVDIRRL